MNKQVNFEDTIYILNVMIRMIRDLLKLDTDAGVFLRKTMEDLEFTGSVLEELTVKLAAHPDLPSRENEAINLSDVQWQYSRLLDEVCGEASPFFGLLTPEIRRRINVLVSENSARRKYLDESLLQPENPNDEPVVSQAEMCGLLGSTLETSPVGLVVGTLNEPEWRSLKSTQAV